MWWLAGHVFVTRGQHSNTLAFRLHTLSGTHIMTSLIWIPGGQKYWQWLHHPLAQPISKQTLNLCACLHIYMCTCLWLERTKEQHVKKKRKRESKTEDKERKWQCLDNERKKYVCCIILNGGEGEIVCRTVCCIATFMLYRHEAWDRFLSQIPKEWWWCLSKTLK